MTSRQLFEWASTNVPTAHFGYCSKDDYEREQHYLERRFHQSRTIPDTRKPLICSHLKQERVSFYSNSDTFREELLKKRMIFHQNQLLASLHACVIESGGWLV